MESRATVLNDVRETGRVVAIPPVQFNRSQSRATETHRSELKLADVMNYRQVFSRPI